MQPIRKMVQLHQLSSNLLNDFRYFRFLSSCCFSMVSSSSILRFFPFSVSTYYLSPSQKWEHLISPCFGSHHIFFLKPHPFISLPLSLSLVAGRRDGDAAVDEKRRRHQDRLDGGGAALLHCGRARAGGDQDRQRARGLRQAAEQGADAQQTDLWDMRKGGKKMGKMDWESWETWDTKWNRKNIKNGIQGWKQMLFIVKRVKPGSDVAGKKLISKPSTYLGDPLGERLRGNKSATLLLDGWKLRWNSIADWCCTSQKTALWPCRWWFFVAGNSGNFEWSWRDKGIDRKMQLKLSK